MDKILNDHEIIKTFSCGCRKWHITNGDSPKMPENPLEVSEVHNCKKLFVYQKKKGLKRYYVKKVDKLEEK